MQNITIAVNPDEWDRIQRLIPPGQTVYAFAKDLFLRRIREIEEAGPAPQGPSALVLEMAEALRERKWSLYQMEDYSDRNHRTWLEGRYRKATKTEILDAISLFRSKASR